MSGVDLASPLSDEERASLIDSIATKIVSRKLEMPATIFLEMHKPLSFIASQAMVVAMPMFGPLIGMDKMGDLSRLLRQRENVDLLMSRIEELAEARDHPKPTAAES